MFEDFIKEPNHAMLVGAGILAVSAFSTILALKGIEMIENFLIKRRRNGRNS